MGARYSKEGLPLGTPHIFEIQNSTTSFQGYPSIDAFENSDFVVTWQIYQQGGALSHGIFGQLFYPNNTKLGSRFTVSNYPGISSPQTRPDVATFPSSTIFFDRGFVTAFQGYDNPDGFDPDEGIYIKILDENLNEVVLSQVNGFTFDYQLAPSVDSFINNEFVVVWQDIIDGSGGIKVQHMAEAALPGTTPLFTANTYVGKQTNPDVATFENRQYVIAWTSEKQNSPTDSVYAQLVSANSVKLGDEFLIPNNATGNQTNVKLATINNYQFVAVWEDDGGVDGNGKSIIARIFFLVTLPPPAPSPAFPTPHPTAWQEGSQSLRRQGNSFVINSYIPGIQYNPSVDSINETYYTFWQGTSKTGSGTDIYGQYFSVPNVMLGQEINATTLAFSTDSITSTIAFSDGYLVAFSNDSHVFIQGKKGNTDFWTYHC